MGGTQDGQRRPLISNHISEGKGVRILIQERNQNVQQLHGWLIWSIERRPVSLKILRRWTRVWPSNKMRSLPQKGVGHKWIIRHLHTRFGCRQQICLTDRLINLFKKNFNLIYWVGNALHSTLISDQIQTFMLLASPRNSTGKVL